ncbi:small s protein [Paraphaeosphaeria sporulosa]
MEALVAVGLAGNVVQFVQFSGQLLSLAKEIKKMGAPSSLLGLRKVAQNLTQQTRVIVARLKANTATLEQEEQHLLDVAMDCEKTGEEFVAYIDELITTSKPSSRLGSAQSSFKIKWHHNHIEAYISRLDKLQGSLLLATTLSLRTRETGSHHEVLEHLKSIEAGNDSSQQNDDELRRALSLLHDLVQQQSGPKLDMLQKQMDSCMEDIQKIRSSVTDTREGEILRWLDFRQRTWRFEEVEEAHQTTFDWIFRKPHANTPWHDFCAHLSGAEVPLPYFINGKAGSGKSTLMKYIVSHPQTKAGLRKWAGQHKLLTQHFFFWNAGTQLQKSHTGMLRSLLHSVLTQYHDLIPAVFPTLYADGIPISDDEPPSYIELKSAFERLKIRSASFLRICIFIDGVDEFEGDHRDMSTFLCSIASSAIKVVVSSRPINACLNVFRKSPTLRLQDLTQDDMSVFIRDRLSSHPMMAELQAESPEKAATLKAEIQEKAEGVFLWVRLVIGLLLRGLEDGDDFDDLLPKLRALPSDLRELYTRMMQKMPSDYQVQASQMFQIFEWWRLRGNDEPLELLLLSFAIQQPSTALNLSTDAWNTQMPKRYSERIEARVRSRCCGLLEVREIPTASMFWPPTPVVAYLHRSVAEFVTSQDVWDDMLSLTSDTTFSPGTHIAFGILSILKTSNPPLGESKHLRAPRISDRTNYSERILDLAMDVCRRNADNVIEDSLMLKYMEAVDKTMASASQDLACNSIDRQDCQLFAHWSVRMAPSCLEPETLHLANHVPLWAQANIRSFAAYNGILPYLKAVNRTSKLVDVEFLVLFALGSWVDGKFSFPDRRETLWFLLQILGDRSELGIESPIGNNTLWEHAVVVAYDIFSSPRRRRPLNAPFTETVKMPGQHIGPPSLVTFDTGESWRSSVHGRQALQHYHLYAEKLGLDPLAGLYGEEHASRRNETTLAMDKWLNWDSEVDSRQEFNDSLLDVCEEHVLIPGRESDGLFKPHDRLIHPEAKKESHRVDVSNTQQAADILRLFLSITDKPKELLNKAIRTPKRSTFKPLTILRKALAWGREKTQGWGLQSEYQFLYQLVELPEAYQSTAEYPDPFEPRNVWLTQSHSSIS